MQLKRGEGKTEELRWIRRKRKTLRMRSKRRCENQLVRDQEGCDDVAGVWAVAAGPFRLVKRPECGLECGRMRR